MNVACAVPNCENPVVGRCLGSGGEICGRPFCQEHSVDGLCAVHSTQRLLEEYELVAKRVDYGDRRWSLPTFIPTSIPNFILAVIVVVTVAVGVLWVGALIYLGMEDVQGEASLWLALCACSPILSTLLYFVSRYLYRRKRLKELEVTMPNFTQFYEARRKKKRNAELTSIEAAAADEVIASAAQEIIEDEQSRGMASDLRA